MYERDEDTQIERKIGSSKNYNLRLIDELYNKIPAFTDVFDEDTWYVFVICFVTGTLFVAFILSRFITIKPIE